MDAEQRRKDEPTVEGGPSSTMPEPLSRPDLREQVTVFVATVGAETFAACIEHLDRQDCNFAVVIIDHVAPISAASQQMIDRCRTPFYLQVDEDMLLRPHAVRTLYQRIAEASERVAEVVGLLFDVHLEHAIEGVKIFRHAILRHYPFEDQDGCDIRQLRQLEADGFEVLRCAPALRSQIAASSSEIMGLHGTSYTARSIYERYLTYWLKYRRGTIHPPALREDAHHLLDRLLNDPTNLTLFALSGILAAHLIDAEAPLGEKDYRTYEDLPGFRAVCDLWLDCRKGFAGHTRAPKDDPVA